MIKYSAEDILSHLNEKELIADDTKEQLSKFIINKQSEQELPLYLLVLLGIGAFIASLLLIQFLVLSSIIDTDNSTNLIIWGLIFIGGAIGLYRLSNQKSNTPITNSFFIQFSFTSMLIGKILFVIGIDILLDYEWTLMSWEITLALLFLSSATYHIYKVSIDRFLSSFALLFSIIINIILDFDRSIGLRDYISPATLINIFFLLQFLGSAFLLTYPKIKSDYIPLSYAFVFSLCATIFFLSSYARFGEEIINQVFINILLIVGLITLFIHISGGIKKLKKEPLIFTSIIALLLGLISAPGILLAIGLLALGYYKHENILIGLGVLILPVFLISYYYNLDISLIQKSIILMGSGILLLLGRLYLKYKQWDKGYNYA